jgi:hypothetical protein
MKVKVRFTCDKALYMMFGHLCWTMRQPDEDDTGVIKTCPYKPLQSHPITRLPERDVLLSPAFANPHLCHCPR